MVVIDFLAVLVMISLCVVTTYWSIAKLYSLVLQMK